LTSAVTDSPDAPLEPAASAEPPSVRIRVWDAPTRLVHWAMALLIPYSWWTATHDQLERHRLSGYILLGLILFRLIWGFAGSAPSRFSSFVRGPGAVLRYLRGDSGPARPGHNPLGGWSVVAMLAAIVAQIVLGLFAVDEDGLESGPLSDRIDFDTSRALALVHHKLFWVIVALIALHIAAILFYRLRGRKLVGAMVTGRTTADAETEAPAMAPLWRAFAAAAVAAALAWFVASGLRL
jgi:cytochrome b